MKDSAETKPLQSADHGWCGPETVRDWTTSHSLATITKSDDQNLMRPLAIERCRVLNRCDQRNCRRGLGRTYWSNMPSVAPNLKGPWIRWCRNSESMPTSPGMRTDRSNIVETSENIVKLNIGRSGREERNDLASGELSTDLAGLGIDKERSGRDDAAMKPSNMNRNITMVM